MPSRMFFTCLSDFWCIPGSSLVMSYIWSKPRFRTCECRQGLQVSSRVLKTRIEFLLICPDKFGESVRRSSMIPCDLRETGQSRAAD